MIQYQTEARILALEASVESISGILRYVQTLLHLQGKMTLEAMEGVRDELKKGDEKLEEIKSWMHDFDDTDGWGNEP